MDKRMKHVTKDFLQNIYRSPYFDAFYFEDEVQEGTSLFPPHGFYKLLFLLEGNVHYDIDNNHYSLFPGDVILTTSRIPYSTYFPTAQKYRRVVVWFTEEILKSIDPSGKIPLFFSNVERNECSVFHFSHPDQNWIFQLALMLAKEQEYQRPYKDMTSFSLVTSIVIMLYRAASTGETASSDNSAATELVNAVVTYINDNLLTDLSLDSIAEQFFVSKFHLERIFKKQMTVTVHNYIIQRRLTLARQMLYDGASPTKIHKKCGFADYTAFYRAFKKAYQASPKHFCSQACNMFPLKS